MTFCFRHLTYAYTLFCKIEEHDNKTCNPQDWRTGKGILCLLWDSIHFNLESEGHLLRKYCIAGERTSWVEVVGTVGAVFWSTVCLAASNQGPLEATEPKPLWLTPACPTHPFSPWRPWGPKWDRDLPKIIPHPHQPRDNLEFLSFVKRTNLHKSTVLST